MNCGTSDLWNITQLLTKMHLVLSIGEESCDALLREKCKPWVSVCIVGSQFSKNYQPQPKGYLCTHLHIFMWARKEDCYTPTWFRPRKGRWKGGGRGECFLSTYLLYHRLGRTHVIFVEFEEEFTKRKEKFIPQKGWTEVEVWPIIKMTLETRGMANVVLSIRRKQPPLSRRHFGRDSCF